MAKITIALFESMKKKLNTMRAELEDMVILVREVEENYLIETNQTMQGKK